MTNCPCCADISDDLADLFRMASTSNRHRKARKPRKIRIPTPVPSISPIKIWVVAVAPQCGTFFSRAARLYCGCRSNPDMAINGYRNKPIGPGGSTRRLHHEFTGPRQPELKRLTRVDRYEPDGFSELLMGANQHRRRCKGCAFARHGSAVIGPTRIVANDNYAEVALAA